jgi:hypothetical protein
VLGAELGEDGDDQAAAAKFETKGVEELGFRGFGMGVLSHTVCQLLYDT